MRFAVLIALLAGCIPCVSAQRFTGPRAASHFGAHSFGGHHSRGFAYPFGWFSDSLYADGVAESESSPTGRPPLERILVSETTPASTAEPLLIELQGDRYVRLSGNDDSKAQLLLNEPSASSAPISGSPTSIASSEIRAVVLVFRDGHREEATAYTISGGVLYVQSSPYSAGPWNRKIELASLDLPQTVSENQSRGIRFQLPNAPNEVVVGP